MSFKTQIAQLNVIAVYVQEGHIVQLQVAKFGVAKLAMDEVYVLQLAIDECRFRDVGFRVVAYILKNAPGPVSSVKRFVFDQRKLSSQLAQWRFGYLGRC